jgi:hypothetical protein
MYKNIIFVDKNAVQYYDKPREEYSDIPYSAEYVTL